MSTSERLRMCTAHEMKDGRPSPDCPACRQEIRS